MYLAPTTDLSMFLRGILVRISSPEAQSFISNSFQIISFAFRVRFLIRTSLSSILRIQSLTLYSGSPSTKAFWLVLGPIHQGQTMLAKAYPVLILMDQGVVSGNSKRWCWTGLVVCITNKSQWSAYLLLARRVGPCLQLQTLGTVNTQVFWISTP